MRKPDNHVPILTKNDEMVLKKIIQYSRIPDAEIASSIGISQQAVFKIRHKLEHAGIIKGYEPIIDFKKIGITVFILIGVRFTSLIWDKYTEEEISDNLMKNPQIIASYRVADSQISHLILMAFESEGQKDKYVRLLQTKYHSEMQIMSFYPFAVEAIIKSSSIGLLSQILDDKKHFPPEFFIKGK